MPQKTLLIVEGHGSTRAALARNFAGQDWLVDEASTVKEAMAILDNGPTPTLLILDLDLPDGYGGDVLRRVRSAKLPTFAVVASAKEDRGRLRELMELGPNCVLPKPYALEALCRACTAYIEDWVGRNYGGGRAIQPCNSRRIGLAF